MARRLALLIGNQSFREDSGLAPLQGPGNDVAALARVLRDPTRGQFDVQEFLDQPSYTILPEVEQALSAAAVGDFVLIYYSGHGQLDRAGRLCLATADTRAGPLIATSIAARQLADLVEQSDCDQVLLLLDCCYSGAVEEGLRGDLTGALRIVENARGFYVITASDSMQVARETASGPENAVMGRFTAELVAGIATGAADQSGTGRITLSDLRRYLGQSVSGQTPKFFDRRASGDPLISLNPLAAAIADSADVRRDLNAEEWHRRNGAVAALAVQLAHDDQSVRFAARAALEQRLGVETHPVVRAEIEAALNPTPIPAASPPSVSNTVAPEPAGPAAALPRVARLVQDAVRRAASLILWVFTALIAWIPAAMVYRELGGIGLVPHANNPEESTGSLLGLACMFVWGVVRWRRRDPGPTFPEKIVIAAVLCVIVILAAFFFFSGDVVWTPEKSNAS